MLELGFNVSSSMYVVRVVCALILNVIEMIDKWMDTEVKRRRAHTARLIAKTKHTRGSFFLENKLRTSKLHSVCSQSAKD